MNIYSSENIFLRELFEELTTNRIPYAVMRNHETLPYSSGGSDLDILVLPEDATKVEEILLQAVAQARGTPIGATKTICFFQVYALGNAPSHLDGWWGQCVDVYSGLLFKGLPLLDDRAWAQFIGKHHGVSALSAGFAGVLGVLKELLNNNHLPPRYLASARTAAFQEWPVLAAALRPMGSKALGVLHQLLTATTEDADLTRQCRQLRSAVMAHALRHHPFTTLRQRFLSWWSKVQRYMSPSGSVIAILGVDGVGKSTVINAIKPALDAATHNATVVQHLRPTLLPPLARLKGKGAGASGPVLDPHGSTPSGTPGSLLRLGYLTLDYILGYWLRIRPQIAKQPAIVIFDRYAYDMALDPRRFRIGLPGWAAGLFASLAPRPDLIICLHADPEVITARKQELPLAETRRQVEALRTFAKGQSNAVLISTEGSIEEVRERVLHCLFDFFAEKVKKGAA